jgi:hypothetical protein
MKKCPTCEKTFDDAMRFCQSDGTPLVSADEPASNDPYKTVVGRQEDTASSAPPDPFKTMIGGMPKRDESGDLLQLPQEQDALKTQFMTDEELRREMSGGAQKGEEIIDVPPLSEGSSGGRESGKGADDFSSSPPPPKFNEPSLSPPSFGDLSSTSSSDSSESSSTGYSNPFSGTSQGVSSPFDKTSGGDEPKSPFADTYNPPSSPIPSPFGESKPASYDPPSAPLPSYKEPEPAMNEPLNNPFSNSPFDQPAATNQPLQQTEWTPPPAPDASWQNQEIGQNTPFQPPAAGTGQNQTLAIVSLVLGILSLLCCAWFLPGIAAVVLGFMAKNKAENNPDQYGGRGLALGGIITGGISVILGIIVVILYVFTGALAGIGNF